MRNDDTPPREEYTNVDRMAMALGDNCGFYAMDHFKEPVRDLDQQRKVYFFSALLRVVVGCMRSAIGVEATMAVLDTAKEYLANG